MSDLAQIRHHPSFYGFSCYCINEDDPIKNEGARAVKLLYINFSHAQGQLASQLEVESDQIRTYWPN